MRVPRVPDWLPTLVPGSTYYWMCFAHYCGIPEEHVGGGPVGQGLMRPQVVVEAEVRPELLPGFSGAGVGLQVHLFVLHRAPQPFHNDVALVPPFAVVADLHTMLLQHLSEPLAGELAPLVRVEHIQAALTQRLGQCVNAELRLQSLPPTPIGGCWRAARPPRSGCTSPCWPPGRGSPGHGDIGDVGGPHVVGPGDLGPLQ